MTLVLPNNPTFGERFATAVGKGAGEGLESARAKKSLSESLKRENAEIEATTGIKMPMISDPELRKSYLSEQLKQQGKLNRQSKLQESFNNLKRPDRNLSSGGEEKESDQSILDLGTQNTEQEPMTDVERLGRENIPYSEEDILSFELQEGGHPIAEQMRKQNEAVERQQRENLKAKTADKKQKLAEKKFDQERLQFAHNESKHYDEELKKSAAGAKKKNMALTNQMGLVDKIGWYDRAVSALAGNTPWGSILKSANAQEFDSYTLPQLEGLRALLGGVLSDSDIRLIMQKVVTSDKNPEANKKIAQWLTLANDAEISKEQIGAEIKAKNGGYRPINYVEEIDRIYADRYGKDIKALGQDILSLADDPKTAEKFRRKVPPGTQLSESVIDWYLKATNNDPDKAQEWAKEDGYDI